MLKKYDPMFAGKKHHVKKIIGNEVVYDEEYKTIKFLADDSIPLNKMIYFPTVTITVRCIFNKDGAFCPKVYLDDCLYQI